MVGAAMQKKSAIGTSRQNKSADRGTSMHMKLVSRGLYVEKIGCWGFQVEEVSLLRPPMLLKSGHRGLHEEENS
jgi:hypothetical protein